MNSKPLGPRTGAALFSAFIDFLCPFKRKLIGPLTFPAPTLVQDHLRLRSEENVVLEASRGFEAGADPGHICGSLSLNGLSLRASSKEPRAFS